MQAVQGRLHITRTDIITRESREYDMVVIIGFFYEYSSEFSWRQAGAINRALAPVRLRVRTQAISTSSDGGTHFTLSRLRQRATVGLEGG